MSFGDNSFNQKTPTITPSWMTSIINQSTARGAFSSQEKSPVPANTVSKIPLSVFPSCVCPSDQSVTEYAVQVESFFTSHPNDLAEFEAKNYPSCKVIPKKDVEYIFGESADISQHFPKATAILSFLNKNKARKQRFSTADYYSKQKEKQKKNQKMLTKKGTQRTKVVCKKSIDLTPPQLDSSNETKKVRPKPIPRITVKSIQNDLNMNIRTGLSLTIGIANKCPLRHSSAFIHTPNRQAGPANEIDSVTPPKPFNPNESLAPKMMQIREFSKTPSTMPRSISKEFDQDTVTKSLLITQKEPIEPFMNARKLTFKQEQVQEKVIAQDTTEEESSSDEMPNLGHSKNAKDGSRKKGHHAKDKTKQNQNDTKLEIINTKDDIDAESNHSQEIEQKLSSTQELPTQEQRTQEQHTQESSTIIVESTPTIILNENEEEEKNGSKTLSQALAERNRLSFQRKTQPNETPRHQKKKETTVFDTSFLSKVINNIREKNHQTQSNPQPINDTNKTAISIPRPSFGTLTNDEVIDSDDESLKIKSKSMYFDEFTSTKALHPSNSTDNLRSETSSAFKSQLKSLQFSYSHPKVLESPSSFMDRRIKDTIDPKELIKQKKAESSSNSTPVKVPSRSTSLSQLRKSFLNFASDTKAIEHPTITTEMQEKKPEKAHHDVPTFFTAKIDEEAPKPQPKYLDKLFRALPEKELEKAIYREKRMKIHYPAPTTPPVKQKEKKIPKVDAEPKPNRTHPPEIRTNSPKAFLKKENGKLLLTIDYNPVLVIDRTEHMNLIEEKISKLQSSGPEEFFRRPALVDMLPQGIESYFQPKTKN